MVLVSSPNELMKLSMFIGALKNKFKINSKGLKSGLEIRFEEINSEYSTRKDLLVQLIYKGSLIFRKQIALKAEILFKPKEILDGYESLLKWAIDFIVNYEDLTRSQKYRIKDDEPVFVNDYAGRPVVKLKKIKVRYVIPNDTKKYRLVIKNVLCELLY